LLRNPRHEIPPPRNRYELTRVDGIAQQASDIGERVRLTLDDIYDHARQVRRIGPAPAPLSRQSGLGCITHLKARRGGVVGLLSEERKSTECV
jgi:hypothetical protein